MNIALSDTSHFYGYYLLEPQATDYHQYQCCNGYDYSHRISE
ncbi:MAG: hypothetical protein QMC90_05605 [Dehalococcoidales bacterium]|nr:hypothetical protein [Dehalococcoidales bacterium]